MKEIKENSAVALGFFDGVHRGHISVIKPMVQYAKSKTLVPVVYTFEKNPSLYFGKECENIVTNEEREIYLKDLGVIEVVEDDFLSIKDMSPEDFVREVLVKRFKAKKVFCGFNYHFGIGGVADSSDLKKLCSIYNIETEVINPEIIYDDTVSSTRIRNLIKNGDVETANELMGRYFGFSSVIEEGNHIGKLMSTPTINQQLPKGLVMPKFGVYTSLVTIDDKIYAGVTNIGVKPTIGTYSPLSETWLPTYSGSDIYGKKVDTRLLCFQRPEKKFNSITELEATIKNDGQNALRNIEKLRQKGKI